MTTKKYSIKYLNSRHSVWYSNKFDDTPLYYFDFECDKWVNCKPVNRLPYDLCCYKLDGFDDDTCVVTSEDSYRLTTNLDFVKSIEEMHEEYLWRENILHVGAELEYMYKKTGNVTRAKVSRMKKDIIDGIVVVGPRRYFDTMLLGYIYKESNSLVKINTYTNAPTEEEINAELNQDNNAKTRYDNIGKVVQDWQFILPYICPKQYLHIANECSGICGKVGCYDLSEFYKTLNIYPHQITKDVIFELYENEYPIKSSYDDKTDYCLSAAIKLLEKGYDGAYSEFTETNNQKFFLPTSGVNGLFDIKIYNATYAYFMCGNDKVDLDFVEGVFTLTDFTLKNPYFNTVMGFWINIKTDGDKLSCKQIYMASDFRQILHRFGNTYVINKLYSKNIALYCGSMWQPSFVCSIDDIVVLDKPIENNQS
jgi:hypothetical protein